MLYLALYDRALDALAFYNSRRFSSEDYGVDQPCQTRYLVFLERLLHTPKLPQRMIAYRLVTVSQEGLHDKYFLSIKKARNGEVLLAKFNFGQHSKLMEKPLIGDIFIEIFEDAWSGPKKLARINYHTFFLNPNFQLNIQEMAVSFKSNEIKCSKSNEKAFTIKMEFEYYCLCHVEGSQGIECECSGERCKEEQYWNRMIEQLQEPRSLKTAERHQYFYCQAIQLDKLEMKEEAQDIYELTRNMSNIFVDNPDLLSKMNKKNEEKLKEKEKKSERTSSSSE